MLELSGCFQVLYISLYGVVNHWSIVLSVVQSSLVRFTPVVLELDCVPRHSHTMRKLGGTAIRSLSQRRVHPDFAVKRI